MKGYKTKYGSLINGDCLEVLPKIKEKSIDLVLTDIPYNEVNRKSNGLRNLDKGIADIINIPLSTLIKELDRVCKGSMYIFCGIKQVSEITQLLQDYKYSTRLIIWEKSNPSPMNGDKIWLSGIECCVYGKLPKATFNKHCKNTILKYKTTKSKIHPTQKPVELFEELIKTSTNIKDTVLDCFSGSSTTSVACINTNRKFICIEKSEEYYNTSKEYYNTSKERIINHINNNSNNSNNSND